MVVMALVNRFVQTFYEPVADTCWSVSENVTFYMQELKVKFKWLDHLMEMGCNMISKREEYSRYTIQHDKGYG